MDKSTAVDFEQFWSQEAKLRSNPYLHGLMIDLMSMKDVVNLAGGVPPAENLPLTGIHAQLRQGGQIVISDPSSVQAAQQYNMDLRGLKSLADTLLQITIQMHKPVQHVSNVLTNGSTQALEAIFRSILEPGDFILCEEFTWSHALECLFIPNRYHVLPVAMDGEGVRPDVLRSVLEDAHERVRCGAAARAPRILYVIPTGQNPTGAVMSEQRRRAVYQVCREYNVLIVEDDAYFWLQYPEGPDRPPGAQLPPGFLSLDEDGRVLRVDTLSKLLGPGYRVGWLTAPLAVVQKLRLTVSATTIGPSSLSQAVVEAVVRHMGHVGHVGHVDGSAWDMSEGLDTMLRRLQALYAARAVAATAAARDSLAGLAEVQQPRAGMFMWLRLDSGVDWDASGLSDAMREAGVAAVPGTAFSAEAAVPPPAGFCTAADAGSLFGGHRRCSHLRVSFASASPPVLQKGFERLADALRTGAAAAAAAAAAEASEGGEECCPFQL